MLFCNPGGLLCPPKDNNRSKSIFRKKIHSTKHKHALLKVVTFDDENDKLLFLASSETSNSPINIHHTSTATVSTYTSSSSSCSTSSLPWKALLDIGASDVEEEKDASCIRFIETMKSFAPIGSSGGRNCSNPIVDDLCLSASASSYDELEEIVRFLREQESTGQSYDDVIPSHTWTPTPMKTSKETTEKATPSSEMTTLHILTPTRTHKDITEKAISSEEEIPLHTTTPTPMNSLKDKTDTPVPSMKNTPPCLSLASGVEMSSENILLLTYDSEWYPETPQTQDSKGKPMNQPFDVVSPSPSPQPNNIFGQPETKDDDYDDDDDDDLCSLEGCSIFNDEQPMTPLVERSFLSPVHEETDTQGACLNIDNAPGHGNLISSKIAAPSVSEDDSASNIGVGKEEFHVGIQQGQLIQKELDDIVGAFKSITEQDTKYHEFEDEAIEAIGIAAVQVGIYSDEDKKSAAATTTTDVASPFDSIGQAIMDSSNELLVVAARHYYGKFHDKGGYGFFVAYSPILKSAIQKMKTAFLDNGERKYYDDDCKYIRRRSFSELATKEKDLGNNINTDNNDNGNPLEPIQHVVGFLCHAALGTALGTLEFAGLRHAPLISMLPFEDKSWTDSISA